MAPTAYITITHRDSFGVAASFSNPGRAEHFGTSLAIPFTPLCQCLSEEILKAVAIFILAPSFNLSKSI